MKSYNRLGTIARSVTIAGCSARPVRRAKFCQGPRLRYKPCYGALTFGYGRLPPPPGELDSSRRRGAQNSQGGSALVTNHEAGSVTRRRAERLMADAISMDVIFRFYILFFKCKNICHVKLNNKY